MSERTLVLVKPDGVKRGLVGEVISRIERKGLRLAAMDLRMVERSVAEEHYAEHKDKPFYGDPARLHHLGAGRGHRGGGAPCRDRVPAAGGRHRPRGEGHAGHHPRRLRPGDAVQPRARLRSPRSAERELKLWFPDL